MTRMVSTHAMDTASPAAALAEAFRRIRGFTQQLSAPLTPEDCGVQSMPDASPIRWHLAHTTWFFETFILVRYLPGYEVFEPAYEYLFNSYYNAIGAQFPRERRGLLTRPTLREVQTYRAAIDERMLELLAHTEEDVLVEVSPLVELGLHHEQQHQELMLTDIKHAFSCNPLRPVYSVNRRAAERGVAPLRWHGLPADVQMIGHGGAGFSYDNERPRHGVLLHGGEIGSRLVTNGEFQEFIEDGGYRRPELWLADGWQEAGAQGWRAPLYWEKQGDAWWHFTLAGMQPVANGEPVCHVSYYEADAYARWKDARLPTEAEWEVAAGEVPIQGNFVEEARFAPRALQQDDRAAPQQLFGDVWEWTTSPYVGYPGYQPEGGALGEYNGKFMCNQFVLRGGSCATSRTHIRTTYRNFFGPDKRWQFSGFRLAR